MRTLSAERIELIDALVAEANIGDDRLKSDHAPVPPSCKNHEHTSPAPA